MRPKLTLKPKPDPSTQPKVDPAKVTLSEQLGVRFVMRDHRYICQKLVVSYGEKTLANDFTVAKTAQMEISRTWVDVPLVPETYCGV